MITITAALVNELRKKTDQPLMDCKKALQEAGGDMEKAVDILRLRNRSAGDVRGNNETGEGRIGTFIGGDCASIVEIRCESAPTANSQPVVTLARDLATNVAGADLTAVGNIDGTNVVAFPAKECIDKVVGLVREKIVLHRFQRLEGGTFGEYVHHNGSTGAIVQCSGTPTGNHEEVLRDVCAHIAALNPRFTNPESVPAASLEKEKAFIAQQIKDDPKNASKPANIIEKMAEGKIKAWLGETALTEQPMANIAKYPKTTVSQALAKVGLTVQAFIRYKVGE